VRAEHLSPFAEACSAVFLSLFGVSPERGSLSVRPEIYTTEQLNLFCGVTGDVQGHLLYGMSMTTADRIASKILGVQVVTFDSLAASAIAELGNMINDHSRELLSKQGFTCDMTPPTIIRGKNVKMATLDTPALVIPLEIKDIGTFEINASLQERKKLVA
jgi:chemotaxis protein CheX